MISQVKEILKKWTETISKDINVKSVLLFGSTIFRDGVLFDPEKSDLDLIVIMPDTLVTPISRKNWIVKLKEHKLSLEQQLVFVLKKKETNKEIVSVVPVTQIELNFDIHKSGVNNFFRTNEFYDIETGKLINGKDLLNFSEFKNNLLTQVLQMVQKKRNLYLKNTAIGDSSELNWKGDDPIPKELSREAAKVRAQAEGISVAGDEFHLSFGTDFLKGELQKMISFDGAYSHLYNWVDSRTGGRSSVPDKINLSSNDHILLCEILFQRALVEIEAARIKQQAIDEKKSEYLDTIVFTQEHLDFLSNTDLLTKAHSHKEKVLFDDIFVYPELAKFDTYRIYEKTENSEDLIVNFISYSKIIIAGEDQSGKTSLCKKIALDLRSQKLLPVYISDRANNYLGNIENKIEKAFKTQYISSVDFSTIDKSIIVPIVDDFHFAKNKEKVVSDLSNYGKQVIIVDDIFGLNLKDENIIKSYYHYKIQELVPSLRNRLIKKWINLNDTRTGEKPNINDEYLLLDKSTEFVNSALGKIIGSGIMPAYPFFILSVISTYETFDKPLDQEITSQGHCYQALLYMYLRKQGVKNEEIDTYINFLSELSMFFYEKKANEISEIEFKEEFLQNRYLRNYNMPVKQDVLLKNLSSTNIFSKTSAGNYRFCYPYIYYFFVGKYLADHIDEKKEYVLEILSNLHKNENAYISIFTSHHSKNPFIIEEVTKVAEKLFDKNVSATLSQDEMKFFDEKEDILVKAVLPKSTKTAEKFREIQLTRQDSIEKRNLASQNSLKNEEEKEEVEEELAREMRRSVKTVEVMGTIIKNRSGSLLKPKLEKVFEEGMKVHLRIINSFIELIRDEKNQSEIEEFLVNRINSTISQNEGEVNQEQLIKLSKKIFWNINFSLVYAMINKIVHSLGSDQLLQIVETVCDKENTPASFIIKHGIFMWYNKNIQTDKIADKIDSDGFSKTAKELMNHMIVNHCRMHNITHTELQKIGHRFGIQPKLLLVRVDKK